MSRKSIGQLHSQITANATQFVNEFQRADNAQRRSSANIRAGVSKTMRDIQREFSIPKLAKGFLGGLGIGGGIQVMQMGMGLIADKWRESAEQAKEVSEYADKMLETGRKLREARFDLFVEGMKPGGKSGVVEKEVANLRRQLADAEAAYTQATIDIGTAGKTYAAGPVRDDTGNIVMDDPYGGRFRDGASAREVGDVAYKRQEGALADMDRLRKKIAEHEKKLPEVAADLTKVIDKALDEFFKPIVELAEQREKAVGDKLKEFFDPLDERSANIRKQTDPLDSKDFRRWENAAGRINVDEMTRRGMGTGANYSEINKSTNSILADILQEIRKQRATGFKPVYAD